jgi:bacteriorhodopsin
MITSSQPFTVITSLTVMVWLSRSDFPMIWILSPGASCPSAVSYMIFPRSFAAVFDPPFLVMIRGRGLCFINCRARR